MAHRVLGGRKWRTKPHEHNAYCAAGSCAALVGISGKTEKADEAIRDGFQALRKRVLSVTPALEAPPSGPGRLMFLVIYERF